MCFGIGLSHELHEKAVFLSADVSQKWHLLRLFYAELFDAELFLVRDDKEVGAAILFIGRRDVANSCKKTRRRRPSSRFTFCCLTTCHLIKRVNTSLPLIIVQKDFRL